MNQHTRTTPSGRRVDTWSQSEASTASAIWDREIADHCGDEPPTTAAVKRALQLIATTLERSYDNVWNRHNKNGVTFGAMQAKQASEDAARAFADRHKRVAAASQHSLTGSIFGDPPPGYSALDQRRQSGT